MTQEEIDLIYEHLHNNYKYVDGLFLGLNKNKNLEGFCSQSGRMRATLHINKKDFFIRYASLVWIYHYREVYYSYDYKDGNNTNNCIDNLIPLNTIEHSFVKRKKPKGYREIIFKNGSIKYLTEISMSDRSQNFGLHNTKEKAIIAYNEAKKLWVKNKINPDEIKKILIEKNIIPPKKIKLTKPIKIKKGYSYDKRDKKYYAYHYINKKRVNLGSFGDPIDAHIAYLKAKKESNNQ